MTRSLFAITAAWLACLPNPLSAQEKPPTPAKRIAIRAGHLIDGKSDKPLDNVLILIEGDKIVSVTPGGTPPASAELIDLSKSTVLPGFIDLHTHVLLNGDITAEDYDSSFSRTLFHIGPFSARAMHESLSKTASLQFATSKPKAPCTPTST